MTGRIVHLDADPHAAVQKLLPWYAIDRLEASERAEVEAHVLACPDCRAELEFERAWPTAHGQDAAPGDVGEGWAKMKMLLDAPASAAEAARTRRRESSPRRMAWLARAGMTPRAWAAPAMLSAALVVALAVTLWPSSRPDGSYHALAAPPEDSATAVVRFRPEATEAQIRRSLVESGARLVDGPTVTNAYIVRLPRDHYTAALDKLRGQPAVTLVEALESAAPR